MTKIIAMTTAATLALSGAALAQDSQERDAPVVTEEAPAQEAETRAPSTDAATTRPEGTIMHTAEKAGIVSMDGGKVDTSASQTPVVAETSATIAQDQALSEAREMFETADANGDDVLSADEFVAALRPVADAIEQTEDPIVAEVEASAEEATDADGEMAEAGTDAEPAVQTRELTPSDYLTAKFEMISGVDGQLSLDEFESAQAADFEAADADGDARLDEEEAQAFAALKTGRAAF